AERISRAFSKARSAAIPGRSEVVISKGCHIAKSLRHANVAASGDGRTPKNKGSGPESSGLKHLEQQATQHFRDLLFFDGFRRVEIFSKLRQLEDFIIVKKLHQQPCFGG